jgi:hypothetical protein
MLSVWDREAMHYPRHTGGGAGLNAASDDKANEDLGSRNDYCDARIELGTRGIPRELASRVARDSEPPGLSRRFGPPGQARRLAERPIETYISAGERISSCPETTPSGDDWHGTWPARQDVLDGQGLQGLGWQDEHTRVRLFWQEAENGRNGCLPSGKC